ncbi:PD-(D/E)XK nuclease family protein [Marinilabiliaceae bacterium ANBcel2]|nr:PD-(D/E)XK nuclease family protein [Marinilabiliaceae bacterium ANBcel2]
MSTFLEQLANYHLDKFKDNISDICFVFPSRRAGLFFNKIVTKKATQKPIWAPRILTITDFFQQSVKRAVSDQITLIFKLHSKYCEVMNSNITIDEFIPLGEVMLNDFNDIDKYLAKPGQLFDNIAAYKDLEGDYTDLSPEQIEAIKSFWQTFDPDKLSVQQQNFLAIWQKMEKLYHEFTDLLISQNSAYEGMIYREVAKDSAKVELSTKDYSHIVFAGFNALNRAEEKIFSYLRDKKRAAFFWDYPEWIVKSSTAEHEAVRFIKNNIQSYPSPRDWVNHSSKKMPDITITSVTNELMQAQVVNNFLEKLPLSTQTDNEKSAVILADENQLPTLFNSIPEKYSSVNITLGFPLKNTPAWSLTENLLAMQATARKTKSKKLWFYYRDVLALLRHQYLDTLTEGKNRALAEKLISLNHIFIHEEVLTDYNFPVNIFQKPDSTTAISSYLLDIYYAIYQKLKDNKNADLEKEYIYHLYTTVKRLSDVLNELNQNPSPETWQLLFKKSATIKTAPFKGEPLKGLQIMGILETRALDFNNIVITGLNEGLFPKTNPPESYIPYNLRKGHSLPVIDNQDSIYAYYFFRLIERANNIKLLYTTSKRVTEEGEKSRFLQQLYFEYPGNVTMETVLQEASVSKHPELYAEKNKEVVSLLNNYLNNNRAKLSPSALSVYIECPMRFYYSYIAKIKEGDEITEDLDPRVFGNLFHQITENIYKPYIGKTVTGKELEEIIKNREYLKEMMNSIFADNIPFIKQKSNIFNDLQGKNSLIYEVLYKYLIQFLQNEVKKAPFTLTGLEERVNSKFAIDSNRYVNIGGTIDRTDEKDGFLRIIDYKTGAATREFKNVEELFNPKSHAKTKAVFQTLLYSVIKSESFSSSLIKPGVISVKELFKESYDNDIIAKTGSQKHPITLDRVEEEFKAHLKELLNTLFDQDTPFKQTQEKENCTYCVFKEHCINMP